MASFTILAVPSIISWTAYRSPFYQNGRPWHGIPRSSTAGSDESNDKLLSGIEKLPIQVFIIPNKGRPRLNFLTMTVCGVLKSTRYSFFICFRQLLGTWKLWGGFPWIPGEGGRMRSLFLARQRVGVAPYINPIFTPIPTFRFKWKGGSGAWPLSPR